MLHSVHLPGFGKSILCQKYNKIVAGDWEPNPWGAFLSIKDGGTDAVGFGSAVSDDLKAQVMAERDAIIAGKHSICWTNY